MKFLFDGYLMATSRKVENARLVGLDNLITSALRVRYERQLI